MAAEATDLLTASQCATARAIVNIFETGEVLGNYGTVATLAGDTGHLSYGRSQASLGSGQLAALIEQYARQPGARFGGRLAEYLRRLKARDATLDHDHRLHNVLRACADDPVMRDVQDRFFEQAYWAPALRAATKMGLRLPLSIAVVYDSTVQGSWTTLCRRCDAVATLARAGEQAWIRSYVKLRREWLAEHANPLLRRTVYRMDAFERLAHQEAWALELPLVVRGQEISMATLGGLPPGSYDGPQPGTRTLAVQSPLARGLDVRLVQLWLSDRGCDLLADGVFGTGTAAWVREYQRRAGVVPTGVADAAVIASLIPAPAAA